MPCTLYLTPRPVALLLGPTQPGTRYLGPRNEYILTSDLSILAEIVATLQQGEASLPVVTSPDHLVPHLRAFRELMQKLPATLKLNGHYVGPHITRKHMLAVLQRSGLDRKAWYQKLHLRELREMSPDMGGYLAVPSHLYTSRLVSLCGRCPAQYLSMWACLFGEALKVPGSKEWFTQKPEEVRLALNRYRATHGVTPCPWVLVNENLASPRRG